MKKIIQLYFLTLISLGACVKTEIVPETIDPLLTITDPVNTTLVEGNSLNLKATYTDQEGQDRSGEIEWLSRRAEIASVSTNGTVTGKTVGQAWILARAGGIADSVLVSVVADLSQPAAVQINSAAPATLSPNETWPLTAQVLNGNNQVVPNATVTWQTSNAAIATVGSDGLVTAVALGSVQITAHSGTLTSTPVTITVAAPNQSRTGNFSSNGGYSVSGSATLTQSGSGLTLQLGTNFQASNGPMLGVFLAKNASGALTGSNSVKLADLASNSGEQTYNVPAGVGITDYNYVVIYCIPFNVRFGTALLN
jgi:Electron transfer DM13/Bacterial Ig-like domain (group 2)